MRRKCEEKSEEAQIRPEVPAEPTPTEVATTETLRKTAKDMRQKIVDQTPQEMASRSSLPRLGGKLPDDMLEDINAALLTIPSDSITETNALIYATAAVTLETLAVRSRTECPRLHPGSGDSKRKSRQPEAMSAN